MTETVEPASPVTKRTKKSPQKTPPAVKTAKTKTTSSEAAPKKAASKTTAKKSNTIKTPSPRRRNAKPTISAEERAYLIEQTAYFKAQSRGFAGGDPLQDWLDAEAEVNLSLQKGAAA